MHYYLLLMFLSVLAPLQAKESAPMSDKEALAKENEEIEKYSEEQAKIYEMPEDVDLLDITDKVLASPFVPQKNKQNIIDNHRQIYIFNYPSDGLKIKGVISYVPDPQNQPLLVMLRGGNKKFGAINPGSDYLNSGSITALATLYRDGVSEGVDEYGGEDVNDVFNLVQYIPVLEAKLAIQISQNNKYLLGGSRGGMQMFLALTRFPELQTYFTKVVSLSGLLDINASIASRPDMVELYIGEFGLQPEVNQEEWVAKRNPLSHVSELNPNLPVLIIQGALDTRVELEQGYKMVEALQANGNPVAYLEYENGDHCLLNMPERMSIILDWLENGL